MPQQNDLRPPVGELVEDVRGLKDGWYWFLILGVGLMLLGIAAISSAFIATLVTVTMFGMLILIAGIAQVISAFWSPKWSGLLVHMLLGFLYVVVGFMLVDNPVQGAASLTLLIAVFLIVGGVFRIAAALAMRFRHWGLYLLNGSISLLLGILIWRHMLEDLWYLWVIGIFVGIEILFSGASWIAFSLAVKNLPDEPESSAAA